jgi:hypothetical protein
VLDELAPAHQSNQKARAASDVTRYKLLIESALENDVDIIARWRVKIAKDDAPQSSTGDAGARCVTFTDAKKNTALRRKFAFTQAEEDLLKSTNPSDFVPNVSAITARLLVTELFVFDLHSFANQPQNFVGD